MQSVPNVVRKMPPRMRQRRIPSEAKSIKHSSHEGPTAINTRSHARAYARKEPRFNMSWRVSNEARARLAWVATGNRDFSESFISLLSYLPLFRRGWTWSRIFFNGLFAMNYRAPALAPTFLSQKVPEKGRGGSPSSNSLRGRFLSSTGGGYTSHCARVISSGLGSGMGGSSLNSCRLLPKGGTEEEPVTSHEGKGPCDEQTIAPREGLCSIDTR